MDEATRYNGAIFLGGLHGFGSDFGGGFGKSGKDTTSMKPAYSLPAKNIIPIKISFF